MFMFWRSSFFFKFFKKLSKKNKTQTVVKSLLLPTSVSDYFKYKYLDVFYDNMFADNKRDLNMIKDNSNYDIEKNNNKLNVPQRFFTEF